MPDFSFESRFANEATLPVCGLDEVGRGPLAGPVVAACVFIPEEIRGLKLWTLVNDSKQIVKKEREELAEEILARAFCGIGEAGPREIEKKNIANSSFLAMQRAYRKCGFETKYFALLDGKHKPKRFPCQTQMIIDGDQKSVSVAAASVIAKVYRDRLMAGQTCENEPAMSDERHTKTHETVTGGGSAIDRYRRVIVGRPGWGALVWFEICAWMAVVPGALGLWLRKTFWPSLFGACGVGTVFGAGVSLRHPHRIRLGERVVLGDGVVLDARAEGVEVAIEVGDDTILGNDVTISCKAGTARIGARCGLGARTLVHAVHGSNARLGDDLVIGPSCYIAGGGNYRIDRLDVPIARQGLEPGQHATLENDLWLGAHVTVLPGVTIETGSVVAAGAVVNENVPARSIAAGVPARVIRNREAAQAE